MITKSGVNWLVIVLIMVISGRMPALSEIVQSQSDTLLRVPVKLNNVTQPDSLFLRISSGGKQLEVKKFMTLVGGSYHPFSKIFRQNGIMVQYGRFISFAGSGYPLGFVNCQMVSMVPGVSEMQIGNSPVFFAPISFLAKAIGGTINYDDIADRIDITVAPPSEFGSIFAPAGDVARALSNSGYIVQQAEINRLNPIELCLARYTPNANGNNAAFPYLGIQIPPSPGKDSIFFVPITFTMNADEAVVMTGLTPPECIYFSYRSYLMNRFYDFPPPPARTKINASLGDSKSLYRMREDLPLDSMFRRKFALIMAADSLVAMHIKNTILTATPAISEKDIYFDIIPNGIFRFGNNPMGDCASFLHRVSLFKDSEAQNDYLNHPTLEIMRVTPKKSTQNVFFQVPSFLPRTSGINEFSMTPDLNLLEEGIYNTYHKTHKIIWLQPSPWVIEGYTAIQQGTDALGDVHDALYIITPDFQFREDDIVLVYGVNHTMTGQAVYSNVTVYGKKYFNGFGGITNFEMEKSARPYMSDTVKADRLFAYSFARHPVPGNQFVYVVPSDTNNNLEGINVNDTAFIGFRLYVNSITKIGPDPLEVILDRTVLLRPIASELRDYADEKQLPQIKVFPNPVRNNTNLEFSVPDWSDISVVLYNSSGRQIGKAFHLDHVRGTIIQEIKFSEDLTSGMYYINAIVSETGTAHKYNLTSKILLMRRDDQ
jgi:hypothetical protein